MKARVFYRTFQLDLTFSRSMRGGNHWVGSPIKAWKVVGTNNKNFKLRIVSDPVNSSVEGFELEDTPVHNMTMVADDAVLENDIAQPGVYVRIMFTTEDEIIVSGDKDSGGGAVLLKGGSSFNNDKASVTESSALLLPANDQRASSHIYNRSNEIFYVGSLAKISLPDFADTCVPVYPTATQIPFIWDLPDALYARKEAVGTIYPVILNKVI